MPLDHEVLEVLDPLVGFLAEDVVTFGELGHFLLDTNVALDAFCGLLDSLKHLVALHHLLQEAAGVVLERVQLQF